MKVQLAFDLSANGVGDWFTLDSPTKGVLADDSVVPYVYLPGVASNFLSVPDEAALDITGDIDIRVRVALDDWTPAALQQLINKYVTSQSYALVIDTAGKITLYWSTTGADVLSATSTVVTGVTDGSVKWVRATLDVDNGAAGKDAKFYLSDDGVTWTQLGSTVTTAGTTSVFAGTSGVGIASAAGSPITGKFYRAIVKNGIDGPSVLDIDTSVISTGAATSFNALTGQTVTVNRSTSGRKAVAVVAPCWLFGTDDYMEVPDNDLLDFAATDSFTVVAAVRKWATQGTTSILAKTAGIGINAGYVLWTSATQDKVLIADGSTNSQQAVTNSAGGLVTLAAVRNVSGDTIGMSSNGSALVTATDTTTATLANSDACLLYTSPSPRDRTRSRMPSSA